MDILVLHTEIQNVNSKFNIDSFVQQLNEYYRSKFKRYLQKQSKLNFITGRLLLLKGLNIIEERTVEFKELNQIRINTDDKPYLKNIFFNISHSDNHIIVALSKKNEIGVDIEKIKTVRIDAFKNLFNDEEFHAIKSDKSNRTFFDFWTKKEATLKSIGTSLSDMTAIDVSKSNKAQFGTRSFITYKIPIQNNQVIAHLGHEAIYGKNVLIYKRIEPEELYLINK